jgi:hypothetical protein
LAIILSVVIVLLRLPLLLATKLTAHQKVSSDIIFGLGTMAAGGCVFLGAISSFGGVYHAHRLGEDVFLVPLFAWCFLAMECLQGAIPICIGWSCLLDNGEVVWKWVADGERLTVSRAWRVAVL